MRIQTLSKDYEIVQILEKDDRKDILIAKAVDAVKEEKYMFIILKKKKDIRCFLPFCADLKENRMFDDFVDFFPRDGRLYMIYRYYDDSYMEERILEEDVSLKDRLSVARSMIQRMVFFNAPLYLQYEALCWDNLRADGNGMVYFNYHFHEMDRLDEVSFQDIRERVYQILMHLFVEELEQESCPGLEEWIEWVRGEECKDYMAMLQGYEPVYKELLALYEKDEIKPHALGFRLWERIKGWLRHLKYVAMVLVVAALFWYLADAIINPSYDQENVFNYEAIGTLQIREQSE